MFMCVITCCSSAISIDIPFSLEHPLTIKELKDYGVMSPNRVLVYFIRLFCKVLLCVILSQLISFKPFFCV